MKIDRTKVKDKINESYLDFLSNKDVFDQLSWDVHLHIYTRWSVTTDKKMFPKGDSIFGRHPRYDEWFWTKNKTLLIKLNHHNPNQNIVGGTLKFYFTFLKSERFLWTKTPYYVTSEEFFLDFENSKSFLYPKGNYNIKTHLGSEQLLVNDELSNIIKNLHEIRTNILGNSIDFNDFDKLDLSGYDSKTKMKLLKHSKNHDLLFNHFEYSNDDGKVQVSYKKTKKDILDSSELITNLLNDWFLHCIERYQLRNKIKSDVSNKEYRTIILKSNTYYDNYKCKNIEILKWYDKLSNGFIPEISFERFFNIEKRKKIKPILDMLSDINSKESEVLTLVEENLFEPKIYMELLNKNKLEIKGQEEKILSDLVSIELFLKSNYTSILTIREVISKEYSEQIINHKLDQLKRIIERNNRLLIKSIEILTNVINKDMIEFYRNRIIFDDLNVFETNWENKTLLKLSEISTNIEKVNEKLDSLENTLIEGIDYLQFNMSTFNQNTINGLNSLKSSVQFGNFINVLNLYQNYKTNKNTKGLRE
jgi:hypothetical protein